MLALGHILHAYKIWRFSLQSAATEIWLRASKLKVGHVTLTTPLQRVICHSYAGTWHSLPVYAIWPLWLQPFQRYGWCPYRFILFTWPDNALFKDDLPPWASTCYRQPTYQIWRLYLHSLHKYERRYKMSKMGWFVVVRGHSRSLKIAPFGRAYASSY